MAVPVEVTEQAGEVEAFDRKLARLRATPEERAQLLASLVPFDAAAWRQEVTSATADELARLEQFLQDREADRREELHREQQSLERGRG